MTNLDLEFDGRVFVPAQPVNLPSGYRVSISVVEQATPATGMNSLLDLARIADEVPSDLTSPADRAMQHDQYLSGCRRSHVSVEI